MGLWYGPQSDNTWPNLLENPEFDPSFLSSSWAFGIAASGGSLGEQPLLLHRGWSDSLTTPFTGAGRWICTVEYAFLKHHIHIVFNKMVYLFMQHPNIKKIRCIYISPWKTPENWCEQYNNKKTCISSSLIISKPYFMTNSLTPKIP
jgi:hypothetical protein